MQEFDVLICGGGSAGLCAGVWLARNGISFRILEKRDGPLIMGQADGVQCRTVEIFESFGLSDALLREAYHVIELAFWAADEGPNGSEEGNSKAKGIKRTRYAADTEPGLSHMPHVLLSQARINELLTNEMESTAGQSCIEYGCEVLRVGVDSTRAADPSAHCVTVMASKGGAEREYRAKYVLGSDGAHSTVRKSLSFQMVGDTSDAIWGVMDVIPRTSFPDIRKKTVINSEAGNLLILPREGDFMVRFYIELQGATARNVSLEELHEQARRIFHPYTLDIVETVWWSAYPIGQRLADHFHKDYRVFLSGDACHTHSPKAGQGMNVSLQDGYNIGWKLAAILRGQAVPQLLETYISERQKIATELIEFDRDWTNLFSSTYRQKHGITPEQFHEQFLLAGRYTAGTATQYNDSMIVSAKTSDAALATGLKVGMRFPSALVVRFSDARAMQLVRAMPTDSRWHVVVFAGDIRNPDNLERLSSLSTPLGKLVDTYTKPGDDRDATINLLLLLAGGRKEIEQNQIPTVFRPIIGKWGIASLFKVFVDEEGYNSPHGHAYEKYGIDSRKGALVVVRPDQYIARLCALEDVDTIHKFFGGFMV
ncbi:FAD binding domain-containing protein [Hypoxylon trugodes]|uniref:FAD binding domain-containing protein n=1 Tax=Hypoxylon trugodes TaxID=326681 RepID=UPI00219DC599|nr:FAD binding domain-containing protein [Hypoxylon trugodes]KAI1384438.1 FAD binding domain-containing protein [Hypoxylon trugodes]